MEYHNTDLVLFPSTYEGFGLPVIEAFASGKPVITSQISPMKEVAAHAALFIDPYSIASIREGVQQFINNPSLGTQLSEAGRQRILHYLPAQILDHYTSIWKKITLHHV
jgi:glycosyltransferase involved in cell wall biosynthesis